MSNNKQRLLDIKALDVCFGHGERETKVVDNIDLYVDRGESVALVGESG